jgi:putative toxin-antitoxin system antitoxin component (TIGR02293 family)
MARSQPARDLQSADPGPALSLEQIVARELANQRTGKPTSAEIIDELAAQGFGLAELYELVVPRRTLARRKQAGMRLSHDESGRAVRLARIAAMAERIFGDPAKAHRWLRKPNRALDGAVPFELLRTETGAYSVEQTLHQIDFGMVS